MYAKQFLFLGHLFLFVGHTETVVVTFKCSDDSPPPWPTSIVASVSSIEDLDDSHVTRLHSATAGKLTD
jgi:hypothetical protein